MCLNHLGTVMGTRIIKQPDGKYAIFSSISDTLKGVDLTIEEVTEFFVEMAQYEAKRDVKDRIDMIENSNNPGFEMEFEDALSEHCEGQSNKKMNQKVQRWKEALDLKEE